MSLNCIFSFAVDNQVVWNVDNLSSIGGYTVTKYGNPKIISTPIGNAVEFDGVNSRIQVQGFPLTGASEFSIEVLFKPYNSATTVEPRFFHAEEPAMSTNKRITLECRFDGVNSWFGDTFIKDGSSNKTLIDATKLHVTDQWMYIALTYANGVMKQYVNGVEELSDAVTYIGLSPNAQVSLGGRMNNVNYLKGAISKVIFTPKALTSTELSSDATADLKNVAFQGYSLMQDVPNLTINTALITFSIGRTEKVNLVVYNSVGVKMNTLIDSVMNEGKHEVRFEKGILLTGIYFIKMSTVSGYCQTKTITIK